MSEDYGRRVASAFKLPEMALRVAGIGPERPRLAYVKEEGDKWCVKSEKNPDWSGGCYDTKEEAEGRLSQVEMFKHMKKSSAE